MLNSPEIEKQGPCNPDWYINSWDDPLAEMLVVYDRILGDYLLQDDINLIMATGLQQLPYPQTTYYYRLRDHQKFLEIFGISPIAVFPRMTRDFLVEFSNDADAAIAEKILRSLISSSNNMKLFEEIENRGNSLFVTLTYSNEIFDDTEAVGQGKRILLKEETVFVAIKNGMHDSQGYVYLSKNMSRFGPRDGDHVKSLYSTVIDFFGQN
jgi:hypothetical protein